MSIDPKILELLVCPESRTPLALASGDLLEQLNGRIAKGEVSSHGGKPVSEPLVEGLVREDGRCVYRVDDGIPNLLIEDRIDL